MHNNQSKPQRTEREMNREVRFVVNGFIFRPFSWKERFKILLGFSGALELYVACEHNPGRTQPVCKMTLTAKTTGEKAKMEFDDRIRAEKQAHLEGKKEKA